MAHIHEKIDWTVGVFIVHKGKVLLRMHDKYKIWLAVGGHIELDEDMFEAARRECKEEVGIDIKIRGEDAYIRKEGRLNIPPPAFVNRHHVSETHEHIDFIYFAESDTDVIIPENEDDVCVWLTRDEVVAHPEISEEIKKYAVAALDAYAVT